MKLVTRSRLIFLAVALAIAGGGVWLSNRETPVREGRVVIDEVFLHRLESEDPDTTHDPAIKALASAEFQGELLRDMLRTGAVTVDVHRVDRDAVEVTIRESFTEDSISTSWMKFTRYRLGWWVLFVPESWRELWHRPYWGPPTHRAGVLR